jgi:hypothetical protein
MINYYRMGLRAPVVDHIYLMIPLPQMFEKWVSHATQIDQQYQERQAQKKGQMTTNTHHTPSSTSKDPKAMDVNKQKTRIAKLTPEERDKCFKEGRCLACQEKGHNAQDCPRKMSLTSTSSRPTTPYKPRYPRKERTCKTDASSDEEEQSTSTKHSKHSKATNSSTTISEGGSEGDDKDEPPSYNKAKLACSKIEHILQDLSIDEWSDIAESIAQDF